MIAIDKNNQKYAISVKTRDLRTESQVTRIFSNKDAKYLREFASDMNKGGNGYIMIPVVAYVLFLKEDNNVITFLINLDDLDDIKKEGVFVNAAESKNKKNGITTDVGYSFKVGKDKLPLVFADERVSYIKMSINDVKLVDLSRNLKLTDNIELKEEHYRKQLGDFGEHLVLWQAKKNNMRALHIDTTGIEGNENIKFDVIRFE